MTDQGTSPATSASDFGQAAYESRGLSEECWSLAVECCRNARPMAYAEPRFAGRILFDTRATIENRIAANALKPMKNHPTSKIVLLVRWA